MPVVNMSGRTALPPVVVMNPYYSGLGIARALSRYKMPLVALSWELPIPGAKSRHFDRVLLSPNGRDQPEALCEFLLQLASELSCKPVIFPTRDFDVIFLERFHDVLADRYVLPQASGSPILRMMDKLELAAVATKLGVPTPRTVSCSSTEDIEIQAAALRFPVVAKPRFAFQWRQKGLGEKVDSQKAFIVQSREELARLYKRLAAVTQEVLVQEYIPGQDADIVVCCVYIGRDGEPKGYFTGRKLRQSPPLVGTGFVVEATDCNAIVAPTFALLKAFGYSGIAEVEFKCDKATGIHYLIEINPRHWDQHELGTLVGINISWLAYADMVGVAVEPVLPSYPVNRRSIWVAEREITIDSARRTFALLTTEPEPGRGRKRMAAIAQLRREIAALLRGRRIYALSRLDDPGPGLSAGWALARDMLRAFGRRLRKS